ncbi:MAG: endonuclease V [Bacteroidia bacterium]|nr:endonuclease V [Bacteroidia bacterium]
MIAAIDVHYMDDASATAGAVVFSGFSDSKIYRTYVRDIPRVDDYVPGQFYKRELPCIMTILRIIKEEIDTVIIDGYVNLGEKPGLGLHLCKALDHKIKVIGVAKKYFRGSNAVKVFRGNSRQPLYVTAVGIKLSEAADLITRMHGKNRLPALLKLADSLSRSGTVK